MALTAAPVGPQQYTETYELDPKSATQARHDVAMVLSTWGLEVLVEDAAMVITELVANAINHCPYNSGRIAVTVLRLMAEGDGAMLSVEDGCSSSPKKRKAVPADETGRGLDIVETLSSSWGSEAVPGGKQVWAKLLK